MIQKLGDGPNEMTELAANSVLLVSIFQILISTTMVQWPEALMTRLNDELV